ncbi:hypothetical protein GDO81_008405 [Engystomops pustulosus]|uniref:Uncharacterized protein n=1 Tax=Engystomops pustulosus TaxID=76066 RepID=A0AAV7CEF5_ENGPU|nr:hypothetical protein GDO81_008405 [Engystomops pustulosus]
MEYGLHIRGDIHGARKEYPLDVEAPHIFHKQITLSNKPTSACGIQYSGDGMKLACGLADKSLLVFSSSFTGEPAVFTGIFTALSGMLFMALIKQNT